MTPLQASALIRLTLQEHGSSDRGHVVEERTTVGDFLCWCISFLTAIDYDTETDPTLQKEPEPDVGTEILCIDKDCTEDELIDKVLARIGEIERTPIRVNER